MDHIQQNLQTRIRAVIGQNIVGATRIVGGYTPAARWRILTNSGGYFVKVGTTRLTSRFLRQEAAIYEKVSTPFMPAFYGWQDDETNPFLVIEDLSDAHWPPPWNSGLVDEVLAQIEQMHQMPASAIPALEKIPRISNRWHQIAAEPEPFLSLGLVSKEWLANALPALIEMGDQIDTTGKAWIHLDLRSDNLCRTEKGVVFVDWTEAKRGNPLLDLAFFLPSLAFEGGPQPEDILPDPSYASFVASYFAANAGLPDVPDAPLVRKVQREQLSTALPWAIRTIGLPPMR